MSIDYSDMAFPKPTWKKKEPTKKKSAQKKTVKRRKYKKRDSIMQDKSDKRCYLCMLLDNDYRVHPVTEEHHVLFGNTKWVSDEYGLRVNLCISHHRTGPAAVHNNQKNAELLKKIAQQTFMEEYSNENWMEVVGKNYLSTNPEGE